MKNEKKIGNRIKMYVTMEKYVCDKESIHITLKKYGVAIVRSVISKETVELAKDGMWDYLEQATVNFDIPISRDNKETWKSVKKLLPTKGMLMQNYIGHANFLWLLRQNEHVIDLFSHIWGVPHEDLICSFDGAGILLPTEEKERQQPDWKHLDQNPGPGRNGLECVQSWVTLYPVNEGDATLGIFEGGHKYHKEFGKRFPPIDKKDWYLFKQEHYDFFVKEKKCKNVRIYDLEPGDVVLWDSRTPHSGLKPLPNQKKPNIRCVAYISMTPREFATAANLRKKTKAFEERRMTSHWPHKVMLFKEKAGNRYQRMEYEIGEIDEPKMSQIGWYLAGF
ncbi:MAG TPA: hypothetical protein PKD85_06670 [Saprospiraceae bacterium]|nr:hypothetical protein [Saprospiraceae bacterium]